MIRGRSAIGYGSNSRALMMFITMAGGFLDSYAFLTRGHVLANAQTGNVVFLGQELFMGNPIGVLKYLLPILAYTFGVLISELYEDYYYSRIPHPDMVRDTGWRNHLLFLEIVFIIFVGFLPGGNIYNHIANGLISFTCGIQMRSFHRVEDAEYGSTTCTGNLKKLVQTTVQYMRTGQASCKSHAFSYLLTTVLFAVGAGMGWYVSTIMHLEAIWIGAAILSCAFILREN
jgi:uncharacterized membrane protein YoaK (UPF0700 family)